MKLSLILSASLAVGLLSAHAYASESTGQSLEAAGGSYQVAGLAWRCGKNNPAMWGTIGNGCLKQKLAAKKKKSSASLSQGNLTAEPLPPPPPPPLPFRQ